MKESVADAVPDFDPWAVGPQNARVPSRATPRELSDYFQYGPEQQALLAALRPGLEKHADGLVADFYRHLLSFPRTRKLLRDPEVTKRLLGVQREYLLSLAGPELDDAYVAQRRRIGEVHARLGVEPSWVLGAYALYLSLLVPLVVECLVEGESVGPTLLALQRLLFLDASLSIEAYMERARAGPRAPEPGARRIRAPARARARAHRLGAAPHDANGRVRRSASRRSARWSPASPTRSARRWA